MRVSRLRGHPKAMNPVGLVGAAESGRHISGHLLLTNASKPIEAIIIPTSRCNDHFPRTLRGSDFLSSLKNSMLISRRWSVRKGWNRVGI